MKRLVFLALMASIAGQSQAMSALKNRIVTSAAKYKKSLGLGIAGTTIIAGIRSKNSYDAQIERQKRNEKMALLNYDIQAKHCNYESRLNSERNLFKVHGIKTLVEQSKNNIDHINKYTDIACKVHGIERSSGEGEIPKLVKKEQADFIAAGEQVIDVCRNSTMREPCQKSITDFSQTYLYKALQNNNSKPSLNGHEEYENNLWFFRHYFCQMRHVKALVQQTEEDIVFRRASWELRKEQEKHLAIGKQAIETCERSKGDRCQEAIIKFYKNYMYDNK